MNKLVFLEGNQPVTNSLIIADGTNNEHRSVVRLIQKHQSRFERWGVVRFMDLKSTNPQGGRPTTVAWLNEQQATFLVTLLRNNENGERSFLLDEIYTLAKEFNVSLDYLAVKSDAKPAA